MSAAPRPKNYHKLNVPHTWKHYWTKYPDGYTILESLMDWVNQVNSMVKNVNDWNKYLEWFVETFDERLRPFVREMLDEMYEDGRLEEIINEHIFGEINDKIRHLYYDAKAWGMVGDGETDDTEAFLTIVDQLKEDGNGWLYIPDGVYMINGDTSIDFNNVNVFGPGVLESNTGGDYVIAIEGNNNKFEGITIRTADEKTDSVLYINGNDNTIKHCKLYHTKRPPGEGMLYMDRGVHMEGNRNTVEYTEVYHCGLGISFANFHNKALHNYVHDNITGIRLHASSRHALIENNIIVDNNIYQGSGANGILQTRNGKHITIKGNYIKGNGEHGVYFQGDNSIITGNICLENRGSGIKLAAYSSGLHWHNDEEPMIPYISHDNIISDNVCSYNRQAPTVNSGIYLQAPLKNIIVEGNQCSHQARGIRSVFTNPDYTINNVTIKNNICEDVEAYGISIIANSHAIIEGNTTDHTISVTGQSGSLRNFDSVLKNNICEHLLTNHCERLTVQGNTTQSIQPINGTDVDYIGNTINAQDSNIDLGRVRRFDRNIVTFTGEGRLETQTIHMIRSICGNIINSEYSTTGRYVFTTSFNAGPPVLKVCDNIFNCNSRVFRAYVGKVMFSNNIFNFDESEEYYGTAIDCFGDGWVISGNVGSVPYSIMLREGTENNIVTGNNGSVIGESGSLDNNIISANMPRD